MEVMRAAEERERAGHRVLHLEVGQPSTSAPATALAAAHKALDTSRLGYTGAAGTPELRARIAAWYREIHGVKVEPERVVVTTGASGSCVLAFLALFDVGNRVGVLEPGYPCYRNDLRALGIEPVTVPVGHDTGFKPTIELFEAAGPLDGIVVASPSNPTGTTLDPETLGRITGWAQENGVTMIVDEIYHGIVYGDPCPTALSFSDQTVVFNSFSKYFSMTGWRLGWIVAPVELAAVIERLAQSLTISPPTISQLAALAAFDGTDELDRHVARYRRNRQVVIDGLIEAGLSRMAPASGGFYAWVDVTDLTEKLGIDSQKLCARWLDELGLATTPGIDFDRSQGSNFVRFSYAGSTADMTEAMRLLGQWVRDNNTGGRNHG